MRMGVAIGVLGVVCEAEGVASGRLVRILCFRWCALSSCFGEGHLPSHLSSERGGIGGGSPELEGVARGVSSTGSLLISISILVLSLTSESLGSIDIARDRPEIDVETSVSWSI